MSKRNRLIVAGGLAALLLVIVGLLAFSGGAPLSAMLEAFTGGRASGPRVLGGGGASADAGVDSEGLAAGPFDGGYGAGPPMGVWLPTATVSEDPGSPHGALAGRVLSSRDGRAIAGAELVFLHEGSSSSVSTQADGTFSLAVSEPGNYVLAIASAEGFLPFAPEWGHSPIAFQARPTQRVDGAVVHLQPLAEREVEVVDSEANPVAGANLELIGADSGERTMAPLQASYTTDAEGRATVQAWPGAIVEATHAEHGEGRARLPYRRVSDDPVRIELGEGAPDDTSDESLGGLVVDPRGAPIEGVQVTAYRQQRGLHPSSQGSTDAEGRFEIHGLDRGAHMLQATHPAHPRANARAQTGSFDARITMTGGATLTGQVLDQSGEPVPAFTVIAQVARGALVRRRVASVSSYDTDGRFELTGLSEGDLELVATSRGFPPSDPVPVSVSGGGSVPVTITLRQGGRIAGVVRSSLDQAPIQGATISLERRLGSGSSAVPLLARSVSAADGSYSLEGIADTLSSVRVHAEGHHSRILAGLAVQPGETESLDVELTPVEEGEESRTELAGIGVVLFPRGDSLMIRRVVEGGGAHEAGMVQGDLVLAVDGTPVTTLGFGGSIDRIRGQEGSTVTLSVRRHGAEEASNIVITRRRVRT